MENSSSPSRSSWSQCFWCISTCNGRRTTQAVTPGDSLTVVSAGARRKDRDSAIIFNQPPSVTDNSCEKEVGNGTLNQFIVSSDENDHSNEHHPLGVLPNKQPSVIDFLLRNSIFIELEKDRRLRVIHMEYKETTQVEEQSAIITENNESIVQEESHEVVLRNNASTGGEHEDDEYWFTKWTRKPRFRSIFEKNTIHCGTEEETETDNNNTVNSTTDSVAQEFEVARALAAAKRRAWAYNNEGSEVLTPKSSVSDTEEQGMATPEGSQKWSKSKKLKNNDAATSSSSSSGSGSPQKSPNINKSHNQAEGVTNLAFEYDGVNGMEGTEEVIHEMAVDCPPDFVCTPKNLSLKRGISSPSSRSTPNSSPLDKKSSSSPSKISPNNSNLTADSEQMEGQSPSNVKKSPVIFFIHGISESSEVWQAQADFFHKLGYEIIAPDLLGHGYSSTPDSKQCYSFESLAQDLLAVFDYFVGDNRKAVLVGHGYGACLAAVISRVRPKSSKLLISISGGGPTPLVNRSCCHGSFFPLYCKLFHRISTASGRFDNPEFQHVLPSNIHRYVLNGQIWSDGDSAFYRRVTAPTLLVYGMKDKVVNLVEVCEMERTIPKSFLEVIDSAGHMVMVEEPVKLNRMMAKFIQSWL